MMEQLDVPSQQFQKQKQKQKKQKSGKKNVT
jgi:hypothetical protein